MVDITCIGHFNSVFSGSDTHNAECGLAVAYDACEFFAFNFDCDVTCCDIAHVDCKFLFIIVCNCRCFKSDSHINLFDIYVYKCCFLIVVVVSFIADFSPVVSGIDSYDVECCISVYYSCFNCCVSYADAYVTCCLFRENEVKSLVFIVAYRSDTKLNSDMHLFDGYVEEPGYIVVVVVSGVNCLKNVVSCLDVQCVDCCCAVVYDGIVCVVSYSHHYVSVNAFRNVECEGVVFGVGDLVLFKGNVNVKFLDCYVEYSFVVVVVVVSSVDDPYFMVSGINVGNVVFYYSIKDYGVVGVVSDYDSYVTCDSFRNVDSHCSLFPV